MKTLRFKFGLPIAAMFIALISNAEAITVTGKVTDSSDGLPLPGVSVIIKGTTRGTFTDVDGKYVVEAKKGEYLIFRYIGYTEQTVKITESRHDIILHFDMQILEEKSVKGRAKENSHNSGRNSSIRISTEAKVDKNLNHEVYYDVSAAFQTVVRAPGYFPGGEEYRRFVDNGFKYVSDEPLSTFSVDVDKASYSNMRRFVNQGQMPDKDAVRIEEFVNYFTYDYPKPKGKDPVSISIEGGECPWNKDHRLVHIGVKAKETASDDLPAGNFVFLIDVSGSMAGPARLDLVKSSLNLLINNLRDKDKAAIVVYAGEAGEKLPSTSGSDKQKIREAVSELRAGGSTAGGAGIMLAYKIAENNFVKGGNNRIILCTDGDFNVGVSSEKELEQLIENKRKTGVYLTVLGYGMGNYKDKKIQVLAEKGNGNHAYIDNMQEADNVLVKEFGGTMYVAAKDVKLQVEFNPAKVRAYRLIGYESRILDKEDFNDDTKDAGDMGVGHTVTALYEIVPAGVKGNIPRTVDDLKYQKKEQQEKIRYADSPEMLTVKLRYKDPDEDVSKKIEKPFIENKSDKPSSDFGFSSAVAMFGQLLKDSVFKGDGDYDKVISIAKTAMDNDENGYKHEFVRLVEIVKGLSSNK